MSSTINQEVHGTVLGLLSHDPEGSMQKILESIIEWERSHPPKTEYDGFEWWTVHADPRTLNTLVTRRVLKIVMKSNKYCNYRAMDLPAMEKALADYQGSFTQEVVEEKIPTDLFRLVVGHEDKKEIILRSLKAEKPVNCLLFGTVASAKTMILEDLGRLPQNRFILGSSLTRAGLFDVLYNERPHYLIIDELDKIEDVENLSVLLSLMHKGFISETKYRRHRTLRLKTWVFASANDISRLPRELLSRFTPLRFRDYTEDEFYDVVVNVLREQESVAENLAVYIAQKVLRDLSSRDTRDAVKVARLLKEQTKVDVDKIVDIMKRQR